MRLRNLVPWRDDESRIPIRREENSLARLQREMNSLFEDFFSGFRAPLSLFGESSGTFSPKVNVEDTPAEVTVTAELPGMEDKDLDISLTDDSLILQGERRHEEEKEEGAAYYRESAYGAFRRVIPLPAEVLPDKVEARMRNGVLWVKLPKAEEAKKNIRKISIRTE